MLRATPSEKIIQCLKEIFCIHGLPEVLFSDNGPQFISDTFKQFLQEHSIQHRRVTPLWPPGNGEVERQNRSILKRLRIAQAEDRDWKEELRT